MTVFAIDFDGTCVEKGKHPEHGPLMPGCVDVLKEIQAAGHQIILWTCREGEELAMAIAFMRAHGIIFNAINSGFPAHIVGHEYPNGLPRKVYAKIYVDDKMVGGFPGWDKVREYFVEQGHLN